MDGGGEAMIKDKDGDVATIMQSDIDAHIYIGRSIPWADYLHYRLRLIHAFAAEGKDYNWIARTLTVDPVQVQLLLMTPLDCMRPQ